MAVGHHSVGNNRLQIPWTGLMVREKASEEETGVKESQWMNAKPWQAGSLDQHSKINQSGTGFRPDPRFARLNLDVRPRDKGAEGPLVFYQYSTP
jgi:hypothetical protein